MTEKMQVNSVRNVDYLIVLRQVLILVQYKWPKCLSEKKRFQKALVRFSFSKQLSTRSACKTKRRNF